MHTGLTETEISALMQQIGEGAKRRPVSRTSQ